MKKPSIQTMIAVAAVACIVFAGAGCIRTLSMFRETQDNLDTTQGYLEESNEKIAQIQREKAAREKEERQKALDEQKAKEAAQKQQEEEEPEDTQEEEAESSREEAEEEKSESIFAQSQSNGKIIGIDPGHQGSWVDMSAHEPNAPGSSETKARCTTGTTGNYTGLEEYQLNLDVSLKLKAILEERGYQVVMTREDNDANISNAERAQKVAEEGADIYVRVHANSSDDSGVSGALTMCPSATNPYVGSMYDQCYRLSQAILNAYCQATGFGNRGVMITDTMTGINWSTIPVTIVEMGFMSNQGDDTTMADSEFQNTMARGIADGIDAYYAEEV